MLLASKLRWAWAAVALWLKQSKIGLASYNNRVDSLYLGDAEDDEPARKDVASYLDHCGPQRLANNITRLGLASCAGTR